MIIKIINIIFLLLFAAANNLLWAFDSDSSADETIHSPATRDYERSARNDAVIAEEDPTSFAYQLKKVLLPAYDFPEKERHLLLEQVDQLREENPERVEIALATTASCKQVFPFAPEQRIFAWYLASDDSEISVKSFIVSLRRFSADQLTDIDGSLRCLPPFFSRAAFNEVNDGYLEGDADSLQKWLNVADTCAVVNEEISKLAITEKDRFEVGYHLMLFMQYRSKDLIKYYAEALAQNVKKIEDRYYPLYCLSRRLKGHDELQDKLLRTLKTRYKGNFEGLFAKATDLLNTLKIKQYVGPTAALFIHQFIDQPVSGAQATLHRLMPDL